MNEKLLQRLFDHIYEVTVMGESYTRSQFEGARELLYIMNREGEIHSALYTEFEKVFEQVEKYLLVEKQDVKYWTAGDFVKYLESQLVGQAEYEADAIVKEEGVSEIRKMEKLREMLIRRGYDVIIIGRKNDSPVIIALDPKTSISIISSGDVGQQRVDQSPEVVQAAQKNKEWPADERGTLGSYTDLTYKELQDMASAMDKELKLPTLAVEEADLYIRRHQVVRKEVESALEEIAVEPLGGIKGSYVRAILHLQAGIRIRDGVITIERSEDDNKKAFKFVEEEVAGNQDLSAVKDALNRLSNTRLQNWTVEQIIQLRNLVRYLKKVGRLEFQRARKKLRTDRNAQREILLEALRVMYGGEIPDVDYFTEEQELRGGFFSRVGQRIKRGKANQLRKEWQLNIMNVSRWADMFDGGRASFDGPMHNLLVDDVGDNWAKQRKGMERRLGPLQDFIHKHKLNTRRLTTLNKKVKDIKNIDKLPKLFDYKPRKKRPLHLTIEETMGVYALSQTDEGMTAMEQTLGWDKNMIDKIIATLSAEEKQMVELILDDYESSFVELDNLTSINEQISLGRSSGRVAPITPLTPKNVVMGNLINSEHAYLGFIRDFKRTGRKDKNWTAPNLQVVDTWVKRVEQEERYKAFYEIWSYVKGLSDNTEFQQATLATLGPKVMQTFTNFANRLERGGFAKKEDPGFFEKVMDHMRRKLIFQALSFNITTAAKQIPSMAYFASEVGWDKLLSSAKLGSNPASYKTMKEFAFANDQSMKERNIEREIEDYKHRNSKAYLKIQKKYGTAAYYMMYKMDEAATVIGWNAVYADQLAKHGDHELAVRRARVAVKRTQPTSNIYDVGDAYANAGSMQRMVLMFTRQLTNIWQIQTYDIPRRLFKGQEPLHSRLGTAVGSTVALAVGFMIIQSITFRSLPGPHDDPDELIWFLINMMLTPEPYSGRALMNFTRGHKIYQMPVEEMITSAGDLYKAGRKGEIDFDFRDPKHTRMLLTVLNMAQDKIDVPVVALQRVHKAMVENDIYELLGSGGLGEEWSSVPQAWNIGKEKGKEDPLAQKTLGQGFLEQAIIE